MGFACRSRSSSSSSGRPRSAPRSPPPGCSRPTSARRRSCGRTRSRPCSSRSPWATGSAARWRTAAASAWVVAWWWSRVRAARRRSVRGAAVPLGIGQGAGSISAGAFVGSLVGVLVLVAVPVLLLGAVSPYAVRLKMGAVDQAGTVAGRLYAIGTAGSLVGTFLSALLLIPLDRDPAHVPGLRARPRAGRRARTSARRWLRRPARHRRAHRAADRHDQARRGRHARAARGGDALPVRARRRRTPTAPAASSSTKAWRRTRSCAPARC